MFRDRVHAGQLLSTQLQEYASRPDTVVVGLARGGLLVAYQVSTALNLPLDVMVVRKIGAPHNEEIALGALSEEGDPIYNEDLVRGLRVPEAYLTATIDRERKLAAHRGNLYRNHRPHISLADKTVIVVDDGVATGATLKVALQLCRAQGASRVIAAAPISSSEAVEKLKGHCDRVVCYYVPVYFGAVGAFYHAFPQTEDEEVIEVLQRRAVAPSQAEQRQAIDSVAAESASSGVAIQDRKAITSPTAKNQQAEHEAEPLTMPIAA